jgi:hypothetical protein
MSSVQSLYIRSENVVGTDLLIKTAALHYKIYVIYAFEYDDTSYYQQLISI